MFAIASLLLVVVVSLLITRVAAAILIATGMSRQAARFQARSAFTGAGFTTSESEEVVNHPLRRRVIMLLMLLGNAGIVAAASTLILGFKSGGVGPKWLRVAELAAGLLALLYVSRSSWVDRRLTALIGRMLHRYTDVAVRDVGNLLDLSGNHAVAELAVEPGDWTAGRRLGELALRDEGVVILGITRADGRYVASPTHATCIEAGDVLLLYGQSDAVRDLDERPAGPEGDLEHERAIDRRRRQDGEAA